MPMRMALSAWLRTMSRTALQASARGGKSYLQHAYVLVVPALQRPEHWQHDAGGLLDAPEPSAVMQANATEKVT